MDNVKYNIKCFKRTKKMYEAEYEKYIEKCLLEREKNGCTTVILTTEEFDMINELKSAIEASVTLLDLVEILDEKEKKFLSGIRYVNNIFKHSVNLFEISSISEAGIHIEFEIDETNGITIKNVHSMPVLLFGNLDEVLLDEKKNRIILSQKKNYVSEIKGKNPKDILGHLETIIQKYYPDQY